MSARRASAGAARRRRIADFVVERGSVSVSALAEECSVSVMTVHRDLDELERQGIIRKFRGGATAQPSSVFESNISYRLSANRREKEAIADHVVRVVEPGTSVMLDDSTTALAVARRLVDVSSLTVVTNYLETLRLLSGAPGIRLIALGGEYHPSHDSFLGVACLDAIQAIRTDLAIVSTSSVSDRYAFHQEQEIVIVKRAMLASAARSILVVDHTKLRRAALHQVVPLTTFERVVVDDQAPAEAIRRIREQGARVEIAGAGDGT